MVTAPVAPEILMLLPATIEVTPVLVNVTAPVAPDTLIPVLATAEVTPSFVIVTVSVALATVLIPVPPAMSTVFPSDMVWDPPESADKIQSSIVPGADPDEAAVNRPCASTVILEYV